MNGAPKAVQKGIPKFRGAAESGRPGAAFISAPKDIMVGEADGEVLTPTQPETFGAADPDAIAAAAALINKARNPVLLLGLLASGGDAAKGVRGLIAKTNFPIVCTYQSAGVVPKEHFDRFGGRVGLFRTQPGDRILDAADLVVTVGYDPIEYEPGLWNQGKKRNIVHIDAVATDIDKDYRPQIELTGNIAATLRSLAGQVESTIPIPGAELLRQPAPAPPTFPAQPPALQRTPIHPLHL